MIQITHIRRTGGGGHEHITHIKWINPDDGQVGENTVARIVEWLKQPGANAIVRDRAGQVEVRIVDGNPPYLRTAADGRWSDNLLALPAF